MPDSLISDTELAGIRTDADEQLFPDTCTITRLDRDSRVVNTTTAELTADPPTVIYSGPCSIYPIRARRDRFDDVGGGLIFTRQYRVGLPSPALAVDIHLSDEFTATASDDAGVVGRPMEVRDILPGTISGYRTLTVQDTRQ